MNRTLLDRLKRRPIEPPPSPPRIVPDTWAASVRSLINLVSGGNEDRPIVVHPWSGRVVSLAPLPASTGDADDDAGWPGTAGMLEFGALCAAVTDQAMGHLFGDQYPVAGPELADDLKLYATWAPVLVVGELGAEGWVHRLPREMQWKPGVNADPVPLFVVLGPRESDRVWCGTLASLRRKADVESLWGDWWRTVVEVAEGMGE